MRKIQEEEMKADICIIPQWKPRVLHGTTTRREKILSRYKKQKLNMEKLENKKQQRERKELLLHACSDTVRILSAAAWFHFGLQKKISWSCRTRLRESFHKLEPEPALSQRKVKPEPLRLSRGPVCREDVFMQQISRTRTVPSIRKIITHLHAAKKQNKSWP